MSKTTTNLKMRIILIGDMGVGKTSIMNRYVNDKFGDQYLSTIGVDFLAKQLNVNGTELILQIWDTAGQEKYDSITPIHVQSSDAVIVVYDVSSRKTYSKAKVWIDRAKNIAKDNSTIWLAGNKIDIEDRAVSENEARSYTYDLKMDYFETSAKSNCGIDELFMDVARKTLPILEKKVSTIIDHASTQKSDGCAC